MILLVLKMFLMKYKNSFEIQTFFCFETKVLSKATYMKAMKKD